MIVSFKVRVLCKYIRCGEMTGSSAGRLVQDICMIYQPRAEVSLPHSRWGKQKIKKVWLA